MVLIAIPLAAMILALAFLSSLSPHLFNIPILPPCNGLIPVDTSRIYAKRMKMRTPNIIPLSSQVLTILQELKAITGSKSPMLFPSQQGRGKGMSNNTMLYALYRMGYKGCMTGHGFRGGASTVLHDMDFNHDHIELQLAHAPRNAVSAVYNYALYLKQRAAMMQHWSDYLDTQVNALA